MSQDYQENDKITQEEDISAIICNNKIAFIMSFLIAPTGGILLVTSLIQFINYKQYFYFSSCVLGLLIKQIAQSYVGFIVALKNFQQKNYLMGSFCLVIICIFGLFFSPYNFIGSVWKKAYKINLGSDSFTRILYIFLFFSNSICNISLLYIHILSFFDSEETNTYIILTFLFILIKNSYTSFKLSQEINLYEYSEVNLGTILLLFLLDYFSLPIFFGAFAKIYSPNAWWIIMIILGAIGCFTVLIVCFCLTKKYEYSSVKEEFLGCGSVNVSTMFCCMPFIPVDFSLVSFLSKFVIGLFYFIWFACLFLNGYIHSIWSDGSFKNTLLLMACIAYIIWFIVYLVALRVMKPWSRQNPKQIDNFLNTNN